MKILCALLSGILLSCIGLVSYAREEEIKGIGDLINVAIERSNTVKEIEAQRQLAGLTAEDALARYDALIKASVLWEYNDLDTNLPLPESAVSSHIYSVSISKPFRTGTDVSLSVNHSRSPVEMYGITPNRISSVSLSISQDLLKNAFGLVQQAQIDISSIESGIEALLAEDALETFVCGLERAYWQWIYLYEARGYYSEILKQTEWLDGVYKEKLKFGTAEKPDSLYVSASVLVRRSALVQAQANAAKAERALESLCSVGLDLMPVEEDIGKLDRGLSFYIKEAFSNRRDYKVLSMTIEKLGLKRHIDKNALMPSLRLSASATVNSADDDFAGTFSGLGSDGEDFRIGLSLSMPLGKSQEYIALKDVALNMHKLSARLARMEDQIRQEVTDAYELADSLFRRYELAVRARELQEQRLEAEKRRLMQGRSGADLFLRAQIDLLNARLSEASLRAAYLSAKADLFRKCAMTLGKYEADL